MKGSYANYSADFKTTKDQWMNIEIPVVMITKNEEEWLMEEAIAGNIDNFLTKPVNPSQILSACKSVLQSRQIQSDYTSREYISEFQKINESILEIKSLDQWYNLTMVVDRISNLFQFYLIY